MEILKGVFGLLTSPKLWWLRLSGEVHDLELRRRGERIRVKQNDMDPCVFMLLGQESNKVHGLILTHVDDLLLLTDPEMRGLLQEALSKKFPVDKWTNDKFEYIGSSLRLQPGKGGGVPRKLRGNTPGGSLPLAWPEGR